MVGRVICESLGYAVILISCLGWLDVGQGREYTWWNMIATVGSYQF
jgi:hypothetical protein